MYGNITISGDKAYISNLYGIAILDISDHANPTRLSTMGLTGLTTYYVQIMGDFAYVGHRSITQTSIKIIDVSDPIQPTLITTYLTSVPSYDMKIVGNIAYTGIGARLDILDLSNPTAPALLGSYENPVLYERVVVDGHKVFLPNGYRHGLNILDVTDPTNPTLIVSQRTPGRARDIAIVDDIAIIADSSSGLQIVDLSDCPACTADLNDDGDIDFFDISVFLAAFTAQNPIADFNGDGNYNFFDVSAFLQAFAAGCP